MRILKVKPSTDKIFYGYTQLYIRGIIPLDDIIWE